MLIPSFAIVLRHVHPWRILSTLILSLVACHAVIKMWIVFKNYKLLPHCYHNISWNYHCFDVFTYLLRVSDVSIWRRKLLSVSKQVFLLIFGDWFLVSKFFSPIFVCYSFVIIKLSLLSLSIIEMIRNWEIGLENGIFFLLILSNFFPFRSNIFRQ